MPSADVAGRLMEQVEAWGLANGCERAAAAGLFEAGFAFSEQMGQAESIHIHVKVDDTETLPREAIAAAGGEVDHEKEGFVKFRFEGGVNLIFSSIAVSQDELAETECSRRARPFVDHFGIDLRSETKAVESSFAGIPETAEAAGWETVSQGGPERGVHCCHVEVKEKHWVYPREGLRIPLEFAFGELKVNEVSGGCDLRPMDPEVAAKNGGAPSACDAKVGE